VALCHFELLKFRLIVTEFGIDTVFVTKSYDDVANNERWV